MDHTSCRVIGKIASPLLVRHSPNEKVTVLNPAHRAGITTKWPRQANLDLVSQKFEKCRIFHQNCRPRFHLTHCRVIRSPHCDLIISNSPATVEYYFNLFVFACWSCVHYKGSSIFVGISKNHSLENSFTGNSTWGDFQTPYDLASGLRADLRLTAIWIFFPRAPCCPKENLTPIELSINREFLLGPVYIHSFVHS